MNVIPIALANHLASEVTTMSTCWRATLQNGCVFGFTDNTNDLVIDGVTYAAATGYTPSSISTTGTMAVDNLEVTGILDSAGITDGDLNAGLWDYAEIHIFQVNYTDLSQGILKLVRGRLGEIKSRRSDFVAEMRGLADAYTRSLCSIYGPSCRANLGDAHCGVNLAPFTVTGTVQTVSPDFRVITDSARTEPGPAGAVTITAISQAKEAVITASAHGYASGQTIYIVDVSGVAQPSGLGINGQYFIITKVDANRFSIPVDTRALATDAANGPTDAAKVYSPYVSGGKATPAGNAGYFAYGLLTFTSGANNGLSVEVQSYSPGSITLQLATAYPLEVGTTYRMTAGCGKRFKEDCVNRFSNGVNFRGEPFLPGMDQLARFGGQAPGQGGA